MRNVVRILILTFAVGAVGSGSTLLAQQAEAPVQGVTFAGDDNRTEGFNWGWLGLLGLVGLMGMKRRELLDRSVLRREATQPSPAR